MLSNNYKHQTTHQNYNQINLQIREEDIDYRKCFKIDDQVSDERLRNAYKEIEKLEKNKIFPPRLTLQVIRKENAQEDLTTEVLVKGVHPELTVSIFAPCPGQ